jgi:hypothetical protein
MSDGFFTDEPVEVIFRAALPGRPGALLPPPDSGRGELLFAPGRAALEAAVLLAAVALLLPLCAPGGMGCALWARRRGNPRGPAAFVAAAWCGLLGVVVRRTLGLGILV